MTNGTVTLFTTDFRGLVDRKPITLVPENGATVADDVAALLVKAQAIETAYAPLLAAGVTLRTTLTVELTPATPASGGDVSNQASVNYWLEPDAQTGEIDTWNNGIPSPINTLFLPDNVTVDTTAAILLTWATALKNNALVSDDEVIDTSITGGVKDGRFISKKRTS